MLLRTARRLHIASRVASQVKPGLKTQKHFQKPPASAPYEPDFLITPQTYAYQLPTSPDEPESHILVSALPISLLFEYTGVETSSLNGKANQSVFDAHPLSSYKALAQRYSRVVQAKIEAETKGNGRRITIERPRNVKLTTRDFIDDLLYNPAYGYFNRDLEIFHPKKPFEFNKLALMDEFLDVWAEESSHTASGLRSTQRWHTPLELFHPYYGRAVAHYLVSQHKAANSGEPLEMYEVGAGNGTLMTDILDCLEQDYPEVYKTARYNVVEISLPLARTQQKHARHKDHVVVHNKDIFAWDTPVPQNVFVLAFEVFDNFSHDVLRYNIETHEPYQGYVVIDRNNEFKEFFNPRLDPLCARYLDLRAKTSKFQALENRWFFQKWLDPHTPTQEFSELNRAQNYLWPFRNKLLRNGEFIPTKLLRFFEILEQFFPQHKLIASDFSLFQGTVPYSYNGPVVQTMFQKTPQDVDSTVRAVPRNSLARKEPLEKEPLEKERKKLEYQVLRITLDRMVNVTTYMVQQGYFDIMFATDFELAKEIYQLVTNKDGNVWTHQDFMKSWSVDLEKTRCANGENPMVELYRNVKFFGS